MWLVRGVFMIRRDVFVIGWRCLYGWRGMFVMTGEGCLCGW